MSDSGKTASGRTRPAASGRAQRGGALLVAMIMIFMMSIMGLTVMRGSTLERRMATNAIQAREVSQLAESVTEQVLNDDGNLTAAFELGTATGAGEEPGKVTIDKVLDTDLGYRTTGTLSYVGGGVAPGFSIGTFEALRYISSGTAEIDSVGARSVIEQGAFKTVPSN